MNDTDEQIKNALISANLPSLENNANTTQIPLISFVDDDGLNAVLTKLKSLKEEKEIPYSLAIISNAIEGKPITGVEGTGGFMNADEVVDLHKKHGFEILSHSVSHPRIATLGNEDEQLQEIKESYIKLNELGLNVEYFVYPGGSQSKEVREKVSRYYKGALGTPPGLNSQPINTFNARRVALGAFAESNNTLEYYKSQVDLAIENNQWLIFMTHVGSPEHTEQQQQHLIDVIDYAKNQPIKFVTIKEGFEMYGNLIDLNDQELYLSKNGNNNIRELIYETYDRITGLEKYGYDTPPSEFPDNKVSVHAMVNSTEFNKFPEKTRGTLSTYKNEGNVASHQFWYVGRNIYHRDSRENVTWRGFRRMATFDAEVTVSADFGVIDANKSVNKSIVNTAFNSDSTVLITPIITSSGNMHGSLILSGYIRAQQILSITLQNPTSQPIDVGSREFLVRVIS